MKLEEYAKSYVKNKTSNMGRKLIIKTLPYWGPVIAVILIIVIILSAIQGFMSQKTVNDTISKKSNTIILKYIKDQVDKTNNENTFDGHGNVVGEMKDYYGTDKTLAMQSGEVASYLKYEAMALEKNDGAEENEQYKIDEQKQEIDTIIKKLKPKFIYMEGTVDTERQSTKDADKNHKKVKDDTEKKHGTYYFLTYADTYQGEFNISYKIKTTEYKNSKNEIVKETKPVIYKFKHVGKLYDPLRKILKSDNAKEDINEAITFITGVGNGYEDSSENMDWTFSDADVMSYTGGGTFAGRGEKFSGNTDDFIKKVAPAAIDTYKKYGVLPAITLAQSIVESGWGESGLTRKANNLFGIKVSDNWSGPYVKMLTKEYKRSKGYYYVMAKFRAYDSWKDSIEDHGKFLRVDNKRYDKAGMFDTNSYSDQANALKRAGYATSPVYAEKLINSFIIPYKLYEYDEQAD